jgi:hypothetical protein
MIEPQPQIARLQYQGQPVTLEDFFHRLALFLTISHPTPQEIAQQGKKQ